MKTPLTLEQAILARRTVHEFQPSSIDSKLLLHGLNLSLRAPNHKHTFPWHFVIVGPETRKKLVELDLKLRGALSGEILKDDDAERLKTEARLLNPAALVAFYQKRVPDPKTMREDYATISSSIDHFTLFLSSEGYSLKWSTGMLSVHAETQALLGVDMDLWESVGFVWVGLPAKEMGTPQKRPSLESCLRILP